MQRMWEYHRPIEPRDNLAQRLGKLGVASSSLLAEGFVFGF
jgi:hypothetical protein